MDTRVGSGRARAAVTLLLWIFVVAHPLLHTLPGPLLSHPVEVSESAIDVGAQPIHSPCLLCSAVQGFAEHDVPGALAAGEFESPFFDDSANVPSHVAAASAGRAPPNPQFTSAGGPLQS